VPVAAHYAGTRLRRFNSRITCVACCDLSVVQDSRDSFGRKATKWFDDGSKMHGAFFRLCLPKFADVRVSQRLAARLGSGECFLVRRAIRLRSFSATAAWMCNMKGSTSGPSSVTIKGTRCAIRPLMKSRLSTTLADLLTPLLSADPDLAVRTLPRA